MCRDRTIKSFESYEILQIIAVDYHIDIQFLSRQKSKMYKIEEESQHSKANITLLFHLFLTFSKEISTAKQYRQLRYIYYSMIYHISVTSSFI